MSTEGDVVTGKLWEARNWSADAGEGSIHDDSTAEELGFRGGTVAGDVHMNQFPPLLLEIFGQEWFERGNLSLMFKNATVDRERVQTFARARGEGEQQVAVWVEREDGLLVCSGTAAIDDHSKSELRTRDLRPGDPAELKILKRLHPGLSLGSYDVITNSDRQFQLYDAGLISDPLDWYRQASPWGGPVACPSTLIQYLWGVPMEGMNKYVEDAVGLFGAIELGQIAGPVLFDRPYRIESEVVCVGESPQTEYVWYDSTMSTPEGELVATMRMMSRVMKASSPLYKK